MARRLIVPGVFTLVGIAILIGLGVWQLERRAWKAALVARVADRIGASPQPAPGPAEWPGLDLAEAEYTRVTVTGRFLNDREIHVVIAVTEPKGRHGGVGYLVMTPVETAGNWIVYVNRGFVPRDRKSPDSRTGGMIEGEATVTGLLRAPRQRSWFTPGDDLAGNEWFSRDPKLYVAAAAGLPPEVAPYLIDADFDPALPEGLPQGGETIVTFSDNHLQYALTWFALAAALVGVFIAFARRRS